MRFIAFLFRAIVFILVLVFALANTQPVVLTLVPGVAGLRYEAPMVIWLLGIFMAGVIATFIFLLPTLIRGWRKPPTHHGD
jgi:lipopolysaccharide assembly protein A